MTTDSKIKFINRYIESMFTLKRRLTEDMNALIFLYFFHDDRYSTN